MAEEEIVNKFGSSKKGTQKAEESARAKAEERKAAAEKLIQQTKSARNFANCCGVLGATKPKEVSFCKSSKEALSKKAGKLIFRLPTKFLATSAVGRHAFDVTMRPRADSTARNKSYQPKRSCRPRWPPPDELDLFVVEINKQPPSVSFVAAVQSEGCSVQHITQKAVAQSKICTYTAATALCFFYKDPIKDLGNIATHPASEFGIQP